MYEAMEDRLRTMAATERKENEVLHKHFDLFRGASEASVAAFKTTSNKSEVKILNPIHPPSSIIHGQKFPVNSLWIIQKLPNYVLLSSFVSNFRVWLNVDAQVFSKFWTEISRFWIQNVLPIEISTHQNTVEYLKQGKTDILFSKFLFLLQDDECLWFIFFTLQDWLHRLRTNSVARWARSADLSVIIFCVIFRDRRENFDLTLLMFV